MAQPITRISQHVPSVADNQAAGMQAISDRLADKAPAIEQTLEIIDLLSQKGMLDIVQAFLEQSGDILTVVVEQAKQPQYAKGLKNVLGLVQLLGTVDIGVLSNGLKAISQAAERAESGEAPTVDGLFPMLAALQDPDIKRAISFGIDALRQLGQAMKPPAAGPISG